MATREKWGFGKGECHKCGKKSVEVRNHYSYWYCRPCLDKLKIRCDDCGKLIYLNKSNYKEWDRTSGHFCDKCYDKLEKWLGSRATPPENSFAQHFYRQYHGHGSHGSR